MSESEKIEMSIKNAEASINMENLRISDKARELCYKLLRNEITFEEYLEAIKLNHKCNELQY